MLIVISDGLPEGRYSNERDLHRAIADIEADARIALIRLGIGPKTEHVNEYYPQAMANVPLTKLAPTLRNLLQRVLGIG